MGKIDNNWKVIGKNVRFFRKRAGMNQEELADAIEISVKTLSRMERGEASIDVLMLLRIAAFLKVELELFLEGI